MDEDHFRKAFSKSLKVLLFSLSNKSKLENKSSEFLAVLKFIKNYQENIQISIEIFFHFAQKSTFIHRLILLQLFDYFFTRCHNFRTYFLLKSNIFLEIFCETNPLKNPICFSKKEVDEIKLKTVKVIKSWDKKFKNQYIRLDTLIDFLQNMKSCLDYENIDAEISNIPTSKNMFKLKRQELTKILITIAQNRFSEIENNSRINLLEIKSASQLLLSTNLSEEINVNKDNQSIIDNFVDAKILLVENIIKLNRVTKIRQLKLNAPKLWRQLTTYRSYLSSQLELANKLNIKGYQRKRKLTFDDEEDDFEDVKSPKHSSYSADDVLIQFYQNEIEKSLEEIPEENLEENKPSTSEPQKLIPIVPYGLDLEYWGQKREKCHISKNNAGCHQFWRPPDEDSISGVSDSSVYNQRIFNFISNQNENRKISCRAKLKNGGLCPRLDTHKCPIHGEIVKRNEYGEVVEKDDLEKKQKEDNAKGEIEMKAELKKVGIEYDEKTGKIMKNKKSNKKAESARMRLQKKVFDSKAIQRVAESNFSSMKSKIDNKFGHQFSHL